MTQCSSSILYVPQRFFGLSSFKGFRDPWTQATFDATRLVVIRAVRPLSTKTRKYEKPEMGRGNFTSLIESHDQLPFFSDQDRLQLPVREGSSKPFNRAEAEVSQPDRAQRQLQHPDRQDEENQLVALQLAEVAPAVEEQRARQSAPNSIEKIARILP